MRLFMLMSLVFTLPLLAVDLPVNCNFSGDTIGNPPGTDGPNQPSGYHVTPDGNVTVQISAYGLTKPCVLNDGGNRAATFLYFDIDPVESDILRIEFTFVANQRMDTGIFVVRSEDRDIALALGITDSGEIHDYRGHTLGTYSAESPSSIRIDVNTYTKLWSGILDEEMNGFDDDTLFSDLEYWEPNPEDVEDVSIIEVGIPILNTENAVGSAIVVLDNIYIQNLGVATEKSNWSRIKQNY